MSNRLNEIRARLQAATPGPWRAAEQLHNDWVGIHSQHLALATAFDPTDADFIANSPADIEWLLAENERLNDRLVLAETDNEYLEGLRPPGSDMPPPHADTEAANRIAGIVLAFTGRNIARFSIRYGIAWSVLHWMDANRPTDDVAIAWERMRAALRAE